AAAAVAAMAAAGCAPPVGTSPAAVQVAAPSASGKRADAPVRLAYRGAEVNTVTPIDSLSSERQVQMTNPGLTTYDSDARLIPMVAERVPSLEDGSWVVNPDGTMQVTWNLRRNAKWHDGTPFTSKD